MSERAIGTTLNLIEEERGKIKCKGICAPSHCHWTVAREVSFSIAVIIKATTWWVSLVPF